MTWNTAMTFWTMKSNKIGALSYFDGTEINIPHGLLELTVCGIATCALCYISMAQW